MSLTKPAVFGLIQLLDVLNQTKNAWYVSPLPILFGSSIGMHVRHIVEFYQCLLIGVESKLVNYDARERNLQIENDIEFAKNIISQCIEGLSLIHENSSIVMITSQNLSGEQTEISTNVFRELIYLIEHSIHHMAILKMVFKDTFQEVVIPENFGIAFSTIKHQKLVHGNLSTSIQ